MFKQVPFLRLWPGAISLVIFMLIVVASLAAAQGQPGEEPAKGLSAAWLALGIPIGWVGNFLHRLKKVIKGQTDKEIKDYLRVHKIIFGIGLVIAAGAVSVEFATYAKDFGSLFWSALLTGYSSDSVFEAKETPAQETPTPS